ncbi:Flp family type IVb pilin [Marinobacter mobilis]|uniref:Flp/Fap pilin component n=1 Tax=Marinobacter mobilis TaxID=488533 RepID=A0A1H2Y3Z9_9GAMM|nr:Flp family type IVb pilin [Marinobacter mobilis]SDW99548.1 Flp/Fap pilin component [Marinobacter mobilis]
MKLKTLRNASTKALIKAQLAMSAPKQQKGATALEYIVLAAAIIIIVGVLASNTTVQTTLTNAFNNLFTNAQTP